MSYELDFLDDALKEWRKLDSNTRKQFSRKLLERCENPPVLSAKLHGAKNVYKIKLRSVGYRLVYEVLEREIVVLVIAVGRRDKADLNKPKFNNAVFRHRQYVVLDHVEQTVDQADQTAMPGRWMS